MITFASREFVSGLWICSVFALTSCAPALTTGGEAQISLSVVDPVSSEGGALASKSSGLRLAPNTPDPVDISADSTATTDPYCYALHVTGAGLFVRRDDAPPSCQESPGGLGRVIGLFSRKDLTEGRSLSIPVGRTRRFDLVALRKEKLFGNATAAALGECSRLKFEVIPAALGAGSRDRLVVDGTPVPEALDRAYTDRLIASGVGDVVPGDNAVELVRRLDPLRDGALDDNGARYGCADATPSARLVDSAGNTLPHNEVSSEARVRFSEPGSYRVGVDSVEIAGPQNQGTFSLNGVAEGIFRLPYQAVDKARLPRSPKAMLELKVDRRAPSATSLDSIGLQLKLHNQTTTPLRSPGYSVVFSSLDPQPQLAVTAAENNEIDRIEVASGAGVLLAAFTRADLNGATFKPLPNIANFSDAEAGIQQAPITFRVYDRAGNRSDQTAFLYKRFRCDGNQLKNSAGDFVPVRGLVGEQLDDKDFCVASFEMRSNGADGITSNGSNEVIGNKTRGNATQRCRNIDQGFDLISNQQWQTIARAIESVSSNWVVNGRLPHGVATGYLSSVGAPIELNNLCSNEGLSTSDCSGTPNKIRRLALPTAPGASASYIWDFAGNLGEWVSSDYEGSDWTQLPNDFVDYDADDYKYLAEIFGPAIPAASKGYGKIKSSHMNSTDSPAVYRGGSHLWSYENVGIYSAKFVPESYAAPDVGFRCVYRP